MKKIIFLFATAFFFSYFAKSESNGLTISEKKTDLRDLRNDLPNESKVKKERNTELNEGFQKEVKELNKDNKADKKDIKTNKKDVKKDAVNDPGKKGKKQYHKESKEHAQKHGH